MFDIKDKSEAISKKDIIKIKKAAEKSEGTTKAQEFVKEEKIIGGEMEIEVVNNMIVRNCD